MERNTKYIFLVGMLLVFTTIGYRYTDYVVKGNFELISSVSCDPYRESCFVLDCESGPDCDTTPYKKVNLYDYDAFQCIKEHSCESFFCEGGKENCNVIQCSSDTLEEGELCAQNNSNYPQSF